MTYLRISLLSIILFGLLEKASAQSNRELFMEIVAIKGIGFQNHLLNYQSQSSGNTELIYSAGGGIGAHWGVGVFLHRSLLLKLDLQFQQTLAGQIEIVNGNRTESTAKFSRISLGPGLYYNFFIPDKLLLKGVEVGAHLEYHIPRSLSITENNTKYAPVDFNNTLGYKVRANGIIELISERNLYLIFGLGFRGATIYQSKLSTHEDLNGGGIDLAIGLRWFMSKD